MRSVLRLAVVCLLLSSCAPGIRYAFDSPLSNESFSARSGIFTGKIPSGWFTSQDSAVAQQLEAWLIRNDLSATIMFRELHLDTQAKEMFMDEGLEFLATLSKSFYGGDSLILVQEPEEFTIGNTTFCSYELTVEKKFKRVVVFTSGSRYIECEASTVNGTWNQASFSELCH
ncbi:MAG: hypothetical protein EPO24_10360, partial [Bacteroidetes bacterium]